MCFLQNTYFSGTQGWEKTLEAYDFDEIIKRKQVPQKEPGFSTRY